MTAGGCRRNQGRRTRYDEGSGLRIVLRRGVIQEGGRIGQERCCSYVQEWVSSRKTEQQSLLDAPTYCVTTLSPCSPL